MHFGDHNDSSSDEDEKRKEDVDWKRLPRVKPISSSPPLKRSRWNDQEIVKKKDKVTSYFASGRNGGGGGSSADSGFRFLNEEEKRRRTAIPSIPLALLLRPLPVAPSPSVKGKDYQGRDVFELYANLGGKEENLNEIEEVNPSPDIVHTPMETVKLLSRHGLTINVSSGRLVNSNGSAKDNLFRCEVVCGKTRGVCDASREMVALEMAAQEFLLQLKEHSPLGHIPRYQFPDKLLIDFKVVSDLEWLAVRKKLQISHYTIKDSGKHLGKEKPSFYYCTYKVGDENFRGEAATTEAEAQKNAAFQAYAMLTGSDDYPKTKFFVGKDCAPTLHQGLAKQTETQRTHPKVVDAISHYNKMQVTLQLNKESLLNEGQSSSSSSRSRKVSVSSMEPRQKEPENRRTDTRILRDPKKDLQGTSSLSSAKAGEAKLLTVKREMKMKLSVKVGVMDGEKRTVKFGHGERETSAGRIDLESIYRDHEDV